LGPPDDLPSSRNHLCDLRVDAAHQASQISRVAAPMDNRRSDPFCSIARTFAPVGATEGGKRYSEQRATRTNLRRKNARGKDFRRVAPNRIDQDRN
jgi:hypothetical protein